MHIGEQRPSRAWLVIIDTLMFTSGKSKNSEREALSYLRNVPGRHLVPLGMLGFGDTGKSIYFCRGGSPYVLTLIQGKFALANLGNRGEGMISFYL